ncbi:glycosyltransferase family 4 protein [Siccirubricoccus sp. KC 17139]|uniref:Glycosyltransferase family 4 protein n=1 Tax=Siccirubricoccus soli TaxID=2899147 RepID=A0ABT1D9B3_9PROT|nr:glycosyltransferase family 1 protein [Siccirubricoccus soli]MCO6417850.1 glycosyltransferase family 4 protein [Siccirubricoccus soli]MCP2683985.1 glycosyltransferase family 4 protein [Siccirubricoccus soli]
MLAINGRFLSQRMTGVQRFAHEVTAALDAMAAEGALPGAALLLPSGTASPFPHLPVRQGRMTGQGFEQAELPLMARGRVLLNLGNTAPLAMGGRQLVVLHDAGAFDTPESYSLAFRSWYRVLHRALPRLGARIVTVSEFSRGQLAQHLGIGPARIALVGESGEHILREAPDTALLTKHGLARQRFALVVGTRAAHKNLGGLAEVAGLLGRHGMKLAVAGAVDPAVFRAEAGPAGEHVAPLGRVSDAELRGLYDTALCLLFPSRYEGFGLPPIEAMSCGCPVIASASASLPEVCGEAALWFDLNGPRRLVDALERLITEDGLAAHLAAAGRARAAGFTWRGAAQTLLSLLPRNAA